MRISPSQSCYARRRTKALACSADTGKVDGLLVSRMEDVSYLSGFSGEDSYLFVFQGSAALITDGRFAEQSRKECRGIDIIVREGAMSAAVVEAAKRHRCRRLGIQSDHMTLSGRKNLAKSLKGCAAIVPLPERLLPQRAIKDAGEVRAICMAVAVAEKAFRQIIAGGAKGLVGRSERDVAAELDYRMRLAGADGPSFETIVAVGAHASLPHYRPGSAKVAWGKCLLIDWGAKVGGYCSDLTRVVFPGRIPPVLTAVCEVVARAQKAGIAAIAAGVKASAVDAAARRVIEDAGFGERFVHGLGHGIGLAIHEMPVLSRLCKEPLQAGMVVTVEPGVYLPGVGGVRIEDDCVVTAGGSRKLSSLPRTAMVLT